MKFSSLLPEELRNVHLVNSELAGVAQASHSNFAYLAFNVTIFLIGAFLSIFLSSLVDEGLLNALISFSGVIMGFVIMSMFVSGRSPFAAKLTYEQTLLYVLKTKYILLSQISTLISLFLCVVFCFLAILSIKTKLPIDKGVVMFFVAGFFFLGCYRMLILPFQIYDIHSFALDNLVSESEDEVRAGVRAASEARRDKLIKLGR